MQLNYNLNNKQTFKGLDKIKTITLVEAKTPLEEINQLRKIAMENRRLTEVLSSNKSDVFVFAKRLDSKQVEFYSAYDDEGQVLNSIKTSINQIQKLNVETSEDREERNYLKKALNTILEETKNFFINKFLK